MRQETPPLQSRKGIAPAEQRPNARAGLIALPPIASRLSDRGKRQYPFVEQGALVISPLYARTSLTARHLGRAVMEAYVIVTVPPPTSCLCALYGDFLTRRFPAVVETSTSSPTPSATSAPMTTSSFSVSGTILPISPPSTDPTSVPPNLSSSRSDHPTGVTTSSDSEASATPQNGALSTGMGGVGALGGLVLVVGSIVYVREHIL